MSNPIQPNQISRTSGGWGTLLREVLNRVPQDTSLVYVTYHEGTSVLERPMIQMRLALRRIKLIVHNLSPNSVIRDSLDLLPPELNIRRIENVPASEVGKVDNILFFNLLSHLTQTTLWQLVRKYTHARQAAGVHVYLCDYLYPNSQDSPTLAGCIDWWSAIRGMPFVARTQMITEMRALPFLSQFHTIYIRPHWGIGTFVGMTFIFQEQKDEEQDDHPSSENILQQSDEQFFGVMNY